MKNENNYIISLGNLCKWMANYAEKLGVDIFPGFTQKKYFMTKMKVIGVLSGEKGITKMVNLICMSLKLL